MITDTGMLYRELKNGKVRELGYQHVSGYMYGNVCWNDGTRGPQLIHRLVAKAFIDNPENLPVVDHIDEDKVNNCVDNLRWCTQEQNAKYYHTTDSRDYHAKLRRDHKKAIEGLLAEIKNEKQEVARLNVLLTKREEELLIAKAKFDKTRISEAVKIQTMRSTYGGYIDTKDMKFESVAAMVSATCKEILVEGIVFPSCGSAAKWIVSQEAALGNIRNQDTISKELRRFLQGRKSAWKMYDRYQIG